jgi:endonuclease/exonuclease/phosphatase family metal-dependent hydrolase
MALLSRYPIDVTAVQDFTDLLWRDMPAALLPQTDAGPFPSEQAQAIQRLASHGAWVVPITHPDIGQITVLTYHASPPVFDGPEDRNGKRNHDETRFWSLYLDGTFGPAPASQFILMGDANLDPTRGDGIGAAMQALLSHPLLQDPLATQPTVTFSQTGPLRVDYVLPSADWTVTDARITQPNPNASRHSLVWVDLKP